MPEPFSYTLPDLVDIDAFQTLLDRLYETTRIPAAVIDLEGNCLTRTTWQPICIDFHRKCPASRQACRECRDYLRHELSGGSAYGIYQCPHGLVDGAAPVIVDGHHLADVFTGQVLTAAVDDPTVARFQARAGQFGFAEDDYLEALAEVPVLSLDAFKARLNLLSGMAGMLAGEGLNRLKLLRQQERLEQNEKRYRTLLNQAMDAIFVIDHGGRFIDVNRQACFMLGSSREELLGLQVSDIDFGPAGRISPAEKLAAMPLDSSITMESVQRRMDGSMFPVEISMGPVTIGDETAFLWMVRDISRRREMEKSLKDAHDIIRASSVVAFLWKNSPDWPVEFVSANVEDLFGYSAEEFMAGRILYSHVIFEQDLPQVCREVAACSSDTDCDDLVHAPYRIVTRDGRIRWVADHTHILRDRDGRVTHYQGIIEDITERLEAQQALITAEREWKKIFDAITDVVTIQDRDMRVIRINRAAGELFGISEQEIDGRKCHQLFRNSDTPCSGCPALLTLSDKRDHWEIIRHEGLDRYYQVSSAPIFDDNNELRFFVHIAKDITEKKQLEEKLLHANKMEAIGTLAEGIAHDFNNILAAILGFTQLTMMKMDQDSSSTEYLQQVIRAANRAKELVKQILTFSSRGDNVRFPLSIGPLVRESLKLLRASLPATVEIHSELDMDCGMVMANPTAVQQVVVKLCTNALHAMEGGQGILTVALGRRFLEESEVEMGMKAGFYVELKIIDTGRGMEPDVLEHIFEPYFTTRELGKGTGMGLALVHGIVRGYEGMIKVDSEPDRGTTFRVYFPAVAEKPDMKRKGRQDPEVTGDEHVLIVDDEPALVQVQGNLLEQLGYRVTTETSSVEALETLQKNPDLYDLLITDQTMPHMTGVQLAEKASRIRKDMPLILCTGYSDVLSEEEARQRGISRILLKPVEGIYLAGQVRALLDEAMEEAAG